MRGLRIALLMNLAPRKCGSLEDWTLGFCQMAASRGHEVDAWMREPMLPSFTETMKGYGARVSDLAELARDGLWSMIRRLMGYDVIHLNFIPPRSRLALAAYAVWPNRVLYTAHSDFLEGQEGVVRRSLRWVANRATMLRVHSLAGVSEYIRVKEGQRFGLYPHRSRALFNGVDTQRFRPLPRQQPGGRVELITVANLVEDKGVHHLLRAFARLRPPKARLRVVGDGPELEPLRSLAVKLGIQSQTEFLGLRNDVHELLGSSDICIHPTLAEAFGLAIAEAMASGCAVVASRVGGIPEIIEHGRSGLLVEPGDEEGLAKAIDRLLREPSLRHQLGKSARQRVCERFDLPRSVRYHLDWCEEAAGYRAPPTARLTAGPNPLGGTAEPSPA